jgi:type II secretory pathway pseudopilin PulG
MSISSNSKGFTLVEIITALGVSMVLLGGIYLAINSTQRHSSSIERRVVAQQDVKPALDIIALELSMVSYNPTYTTNIWVNPSTCAFDASTPQVYRGLQLATANSIVVEMDATGSAGNDGDGALDDANEVIRYTYDVANETILRGTNCGTNQPFLGSAVAGQKAVRVINNSLGIPGFRYFNGQGAEIAVSGTDLGGQIPNVRRIEIVLAVETEDVDANSGQRKRLIYSTSVIPRNHAIQW